MEPWLKIILIILGSYTALCVIFYFVHEFFMFHPEKLPRNFRYKYPFPFEERNFDMEDGGLINAIHFRIPNTKGVVFYVKGNSRSIKGWGKFARDFVSKGYDFFMIDYRGFGKSKGKRTEEIMYNDLQHVYKWLTTQYPEEDIIIYGRSIGSGFAARIASWNTPKMLILDSPYYSMLTQIQRFAGFLPVKWLLTYQVRTDLFIRKVTCPVFIIHGRKDRLIPFKAGKALHERVPDHSILFPVDEAGHNNLPSFPEYHEFLYNVMNNNEYLQNFKEKIKEIVRPKSL